mgnify:CR=1 FL=1
MGESIPAAADPEGMSTLDEPVSETIVSDVLLTLQKRDLMRIYNKLRIVINPFELGFSNQPDNIE